MNEQTVEAGAELTNACNKESKPTVTRTPFYIGSISVLPIVAALGIGLFTFSLWWTIEYQEQTVLRSKVQAEASDMAAHISADLGTRMLSLERMAGRWTVHGDTREAEFVKDAEALISDLPGFQAIEWVDREYYVRWVVPLAGNEQAVNFNLASEEQRRLALEKAKTSAAPTVTLPINVVQGGKGFLIYFPVYVQGEFDGFLLAVFRTQEWLDYIVNLQHQYIVKNDFQVIVKFGDIPVYEKPGWNDVQNLDLEAAATTKIADHQLSVHVRPTQAYMNQAKNSTVVAMAGTLLTVLVAFVIHLFQQASIQARNAQRANLSLETEAAERKKSEEQVRLLLTSTAEGIYGIDMEGNCTFANPSCLNMIGCERMEDVLGKNMHQLVHYAYPDGQLMPVEDCKIYKAFRRGRKIHVDNEVFYKADGSSLPVEYFSYPQFQNGQVIGAVVAFFDITERLQMAEHVRELNRQVRQSLEEEVEKRTEQLQSAMAQLMEREKLASLGSLVAGISHEINTPLGISVSIGSYLEKINHESRLKLSEGTMSRHGLLNFMESLEESITILNNNLSRASELIRSFKQISVNQSSEVQVKFHLGDYIKVVLTTLKPAYKNKNYTFEVECPETLLIYSYPGAMSQIITNLIMNSLIHGFKDRASGVIRIRAEEKDDSVTITYSDNGVGIPQENLPRIYDPFFTTNRAHGGSGLGMNIVYNLITNKLNGSIQCISTPDQGTTFIIQLPIEKGSETNGP